MTASTSYSEIMKVLLLPVAQVKTPRLTNATFVNVERVALINMKTLFGTSHVLVKHLSVIIGEGGLPGPEIGNMYQLQ